MPKKKSSFTVIHRAFKICRQDIGYKLFCLREIKKCPDNYNKDYVSRVRDGLSMAMSWYYRMLKDYPALKEAVQQDLFKQESMK